MWARTPSKKWYYSIFHIASNNCLRPDFQLRRKIRSPILLDKEHAWSKAIGNNFLLLLFTWILISVLSVVFKKTLCEKVWDKRYAIWFDSMFMVNVLIWMYEAYISKRGYSKNFIFLKIDYSIEINVPTNPTYILYFDFIKIKFC